MPPPPDDEDLEKTRISTRRLGSPWQLVLPDGRRHTVEGVILIGRNPSPRVDWPAAGLLPVDDATKSVSKTHAAIELDSEGLWITDLESTNGVVVTAPDGGELGGAGRLRIEAGGTVELGNYVIQVEGD